MNRLLIVFTVAGVLIWVSSQQSDDLGVLVVDIKTSPDIDQEFALASSDTKSDVSISPVISKVKEPVSKDQVINIGPDLPPPDIEYIDESNNRFIHFSDVVSIGKDISFDHIDRESYFLDEPRSIGESLDTDNLEPTDSNEEPIDIGPPLDADSPIIIQDSSEIISVGEYLPIP
jgi:hypothetical protein